MASPAVSATSTELTASCCLPVSLSRPGPHVGQSAVERASGLAPCTLPGRCLFYSLCLSSSPACLALLTLPSCAPARAPATRSPPTRGAGCTPRFTIARRPSPPPMAAVAAAAAATTHNLYAALNLEQSAQSAHAACCSEASPTPEAWSPETWPNLILLRPPGTLMAEPFPTPTALGHLAAWGVAPGNQLCPQDDDPQSVTMYLFWSSLRTGRKHLRAFLEEKKRKETNRKRFHRCSAARVLARLPLQGPGPAAQSPHSISAQRPAEETRG